MATIKEINHDSSTTLGDHYDTVSDPDGAYTVKTAAALNGSTNGLEFDFDLGTDTGTLEESFTLSSDDIRWRIRYKLDNLTYADMSSDSVVPIRLALNDSDTGSGSIFQVNLIGKSGGTFAIECRWQDDSGTNNQLGGADFAISATGEVCVEVRAIRETNSTSGDGEVQLFIDGVSKAEILTADNNAKWPLIDEMLVTIDSSDSDFTGEMYIDEILIDDDNATALCPAAERLWLTTDGGATWNDISDSSWADEIGGVAVVPGTSYQTIYAQVGDTIYKTTNQGSSWASETTVGYDTEFMKLLRDQATLYVANAASGGNRASTWDGSSLTHINTGKSTTGGATSGDGTV